LRQNLHAVRQLVAARQQQPASFTVEEVLPQTRVALLSCLAAASLRAAVTVANIVSENFIGHGTTLNALLTNRTPRANNCALTKIASKPANITIHASTKRDTHLQNARVNFT
jgi:hypothetical protein